MGDIVILTERGDGVDCPNYIRAFVSQQIKGIDRETRAITHVISTDSIDRMGDVVEPSGADFSSYRKNPVVLVDHDYRTEKVVGRARSLEIDADSISATTEFRDTSLAAEAFALASEGLAGWSIGFRPLKRHYILDGVEGGCERCVSIATARGRSSKGKAQGEDASRLGIHFTKWELLEYSLVAIPANQDVVNNAVQRGLLSGEHAPLFFRPISTIATAPDSRAALPEASQLVLGPSQSVAVKKALAIYKRDAQRRKALELIDEILRRDTNV